MKSNHIHIFAIFFAFSTCEEMLLDIFLIQFDVLRIAALGDAGFHLAIGLGMSVQELQECLMVLGSSGIVVFAHQSLESLGRMVVSADILGGSIHTVAHSDKTDDGEIRRLTVVERIWIALAIIPLMMSLRHIAIWLQHRIGIEYACRKDRMNLDDSILMVVDAAIAVANDGRHVDLAEIVI